MIQILSKEEIVALKKGGEILKTVLSEVVAMVKPGISSIDLDTYAEKRLRELGSVPTFKGYTVQGLSPYPATLCVSINDEIVHGIPSKSKVLDEGDIVSLDIGAKYDGICTDMATTVGIGEIKPEYAKLLAVTKKSLELGIKAVKEGEHIGIIGQTVQKYVEDQGFAVVKDLVGHGIGNKPQMEPSIPNYGKFYDGPIIQAGMALAIEPMATTGTDRIKNSDGGWVYSTADGSIAAHFEHTVIVENGKATVVTA